MTDAVRRPTVAGMEVTFTRTGERRYGVLAVAPGKAPQWINSAPGYDPDVPHDLVHYLVEAELKLTSGVFGRVAAGGSGLFAPAEDVRDHRERRRQRRRQQKREERLRRDDNAGRGDMALSEYFATICDMAWKLRHGRIREAPGWAVPERLSNDEHARMERVLARLNRVAPLWGGLPVGGSLTFTWPDPEPTACWAGGPVTTMS